MIHDFNKKNSDQVLHNKVLNIRQSVLGAQVLSVQTDSLIDLFFLSDVQLDGKPYRGGVPVLFPQFAKFGNLSKHGYVRNIDWQVISESTEDALITKANVHLPKTDNWQHECDLDLTTKLTSNRIEMLLSITNTNKTDAFEFTGGLHPYFYVADTAKFTITGLHQVAFNNYSDEDLHQATGSFSIDGNRIERLYESAPDVVFTNGTNRYKLSCTGFNQWMVWNCGKKDALAMKDLPDDDWKKFICIEPVIVENPVKLNAGETFSASMTVEQV